MRKRISWEGGANGVRQSTEDGRDASWEHETTGGRIANLVTPEEFAGLVALLVNTVYFRGECTEPFDPVETTMVEGMDGARWREWVDALRGEARTEVQLPRFELTYEKVDEEGTETAAATTGTAFAVSETPVLQADRPFLFAIRERLSGTILFVGTVSDPNS